MIKNSQFFKYNPTETISKEDLELLLKYNGFFQTAKAKHGPIFTDYITTHYDKQGFNVVKDGAFYEHLKRTDPALVHDINKIRDEIHDAWITQVRLNELVQQQQTSKIKIKLTDMEKILNNKKIIDPESEIKTEKILISSSPELEVGVDENFSNSSSSASSPPLPNNHLQFLASPMEPEFFDLGLAIDFATDLFYELPFNLCGLVLVFLAIIKLYRNRHNVPIYLIDIRFNRSWDCVKSLSQLSQNI